MYEYELVREQLLLFFLTEFREDTEVSYVEEKAREYLTRTFNSEWVDNFWDNLGELVISDLVAEYNMRIEEGFPINYTFVDEECRKIKGWANPKIDNNVSNFQQALLTLTDGEFEGLSGRILNFAGCDDAWVTPSSHDQGLDAFGYVKLINLPKISKSEDDFVIWVLVQAKHYNKEKICSRDIREFVGSGVLAKYNIYAVGSEKYKALRLRPLGPTALMFVTSGEVKRTAYILASKSGINLMTSSDLCKTFHTYWESIGVGIPTSPEELSALLREEAAKVPTIH